MTWERLIEKMHKIRNDWSVIDWLYHVFYFVKEKITNLEDRCTVLEARCTALEQKVVEIFQTLTNHEERITSVENTQDEQENEISELCYHKGDVIQFNSSLKTVARYGSSSSSENYVITAPISFNKVIPSALINEATLSGQQLGYRLYSADGTLVSSGTTISIEMKERSYGYVDPYLRIEIEPVTGLSTNGVYLFYFYNSNLVITL